MKINGKCYNDASTKRTDYVMWSGSLKDSE